MVKQSKRWDRPKQHGEFTMQVSTLLLLVAILTHEKVGRDFLIGIFEIFDAESMINVIRAFSLMTDRLLLIAALIAIGLGFFNFMRKSPSRQFWFEAALCVALVAWIGR